MTRLRTFGASARQARPRSMPGPRVAPIYEQLARAIPERCPWHPDCSIARIAATTFERGRLTGGEVTFECGRTGIIVVEKEPAE